MLGQAFAAFVADLGAGVPLGAAWGRLRARLAHVPAPSTSSASLESLYAPDRPYQAPTGGTPNTGSYAHGDGADGWRAPMGQPVPFSDPSFGPYGSPFMAGVAGVVAGFGTQVAQALTPPVALGAAAPSEHAGLALAQAVAAGAVAPPPAVPYGALPQGDSNAYWSAVSGLLAGADPAAAVRAVVDLQGPAAVINSAAPEQVATVGQYQALVLGQYAGGTGVHAIGAPVDVSRGSTPADNALTVDYLKGVLATGAYNHDLPAISSRQAVSSLLYSMTGDSAYLADNHT